MKYSELITLYKNNSFREIDEQPNARKFYLLRSISKSRTLRLFCEQYNLSADLDSILDNDSITEEIIIDFIKDTFIPKSDGEIKQIEAELNKMQNFDWGGSMGNNLEKNIVNNFIKRCQNTRKLMTL